MPSRKPKRGGARPGAGRPRKDGALSLTLSPRFAPAELEILDTVLLPGETRSGFARTAVLGLVARRALDQRAK